MSSSDDVAAPEPGERAVATGGSTMGAAAVDAPATPAVPTATGDSWRRFLVALGFLAPALVLLSALVVYPIVFTVVRSLYDRSGAFTGLGNYHTMFTSGTTLQALKNNAIWVLVAPALVTALGLVFAVLVERVRFATAFKVVIFMPMAISMLAAGIIFRLVYEQSPERGVANAVVVGVHDVFAQSSQYPGARPRDPQGLRAERGALVTARQYSPGQQVLLPLVGIPAGDLPKDAEAASVPASGEGLTGTVWFDFARGGGGRPGQVDPNESGLPGMKVQALRDGKVVATDETDKSGAFAFSGLDPGSYTVRLAASNFREPFNGVRWLGPALITPSIIISYIWMWAGFAMVLIAAGLAAIPRDALEAARVDGATEWQTFRRVTVPLLSPVLVVVLVTLVINVIKIFDLVFVIAPGSVQDDANVIALEMWRQAFGARDEGLGSALGVFLFVLVLPFMIFNIRRFKQEQ